MRSTAQSKFISAYNDRTAGDEDVCGSWIEDCIAGNKLIDSEPYLMKYVVWLYPPPYTEPMPALLPASPGSLFRTWLLRLVGLLRGRIRSAVSTFV